jgi:hypothetical protein
LSFLKYFIHFLKPFAAPVATVFCVAAFLFKRQKKSLAKETLMPRVTMLARLMVFDFSVSY